MNSVAVPRVTRILPELTDGTSNPRWCECDDGVTRLVKFHRPGPKELAWPSHGPKTCFNELVASRLGLLIGAPVLRACVVLVPPNVISDDDTKLGARPGLHCGTAKLCGRAAGGKTTPNGPMQIDPRGVMNLEELPRAAVFLAWLQIEDHAMDTRDGVPSYDTGFFYQQLLWGVRYIVLDLEHAFVTPEWTDESIRSSTQEFVLPIHLAKHLSALPSDQVANHFQLLGAIPESTIASCFVDVPAEWCESADAERARAWAFERSRALTERFSLDGCVVRVRGA